MSIDPDEDRDAGRALTQALRPAVRDTLEPRRRERPIPSNGIEYNIASPYRESDEVTKLRAENERLRDELAVATGEAIGIQPCPFTMYGSDDPHRNDKQRCPFCTTPSTGGFWSRMGNGKYSGESLYDWYPSPAICIGRRYGFLWLKVCRVTVPHRHRVCSNCDRTWVEHAHPPAVPEEKLELDRSHSPGAGPGLRIR